MTRVTWSAPADRRFEAGLDRGMLYPSEAPGVAWNGLTAVEETGSEGTTVYFMDGRPYLNFPQPKEYQANLKAITFPDEFLPIMGMPEAAPGMYLDSQIMDSFGLCYRTLLGDALVGIEAGYKLHLVYNATATPAGISYATMSSELTPNEFAWTINAVPMPISGYRPTAHIVIDTRGVDPEALETLENMLYGTVSTAPEMPSPQTIFDLLSYGDSIIITNNGNGTWTAEGSSENIYMLTPDVFQIDNVTAVDTVPGEYYNISTTP